jgi:predicted ATP-dependent endonuclease of OLD family
MRLTKIDILKYKSIKKPIEIFLNENKVVVLIGKNSSGKTNVLEAIHYAFTKKPLYGRNREECEIDYHIELSNEEMDAYASCVNIKEKSKEIVVNFDSKKPEKIFLDSSLICVEAQHYKQEIENIIDKFQKASNKYIKALKSIESSGKYFGDYINVDIENVKYGSLTRLMQNQIDNCEKNINEQVKYIKEFLSSIFDGDKISMDRYERYSYRNSLYFWEIPFYKISEEEQISLSPIVAQCLNINKEQLEMANSKLNDKIKEINKELDSEYNELENCLDDFNKKKEEISNILDGKSDSFYTEKERINRQFNSIMQEIKNIIYCDCYFIDNENSLLFDNSEDQFGRRNRIQYYWNLRNPIIEAFNKYLIEKKIFTQEENFEKTDKLSNQQIKKAVKVLNSDFLPSLVPNFENNEIDKFSVDYKDGHINLFVHEKNGEKVSFDNTSLGRRWYLTYKFTKALLKKGDMIFIDEPAAFLHPQAQYEFRAELDDLAKRGIHVFYSTHSPYMIPEDWGSVFNITMTKSGTHVSKFETGDELCESIKNELGATRTADILFNLEKTILLVEGITDKTCIEKFAKILKYDLRGYKILPCNGSPIFDVTYLCINQHIKFKALFDLDNKNKPEQWLKKQYGYKEYLGIFENNPNCVFTPENGNKKSLEDCFNEKDSDRYCSEYQKKDRSGKIIREKKIDYQKIESAIEFEDETKKNFEQLFNKLEIPKLDTLDSK